MKKPDPINPPHYRGHPSGVKDIETFLHWWLDHFEEGALDAEFLADSLTVENLKYDELPHHMHQYLRAFRGRIQSQRFIAARTAIKSYRRDNVKRDGDDPVNHPKHYTSSPSGVECITITESMGFNLGNAVKYIWRADLKGDAIEDLRKAAWYLEREITRRTKMKGG